MGGPLSAGQLAEDGSGLLHLSVLYNNPLTLCYLIRKGAPLEARDKAGNTPLHTSCVYAQADATRILVSAGADVHATNREGFTPLLMASSHSSLGCLNVLVAKRAKLGLQPGGIARLNAFRRAAVENEVVVPYVTDLDALVAPAPRCLRRKASAVHFLRSEVPSTDDGEIL